MCIYDPILSSQEFASGGGGGIGYERLPIRGNKLSLIPLHDEECSAAVGAAIVTVCHRGSTFRIHRF